MGPRDGAGVKGLSDWVTHVRPKKDQNGAICVMDLKNINNTKFTMRLLHRHT